MFRRAIVWEELGEIFSLIDSEDKWHQGSYEKDGKLCALGAAKKFDFDEGVDEYIRQAAEILIEKSGLRLNSAGVYIHNGRDISTKAVIVLGYEEMFSLARERCLS